MTLLRRLLFPCVVGGLLWVVIIWAIWGWIG